MTKLTTSGVVRDILTRDPEMPSDEVIRWAKSKGLRATDEQIRKSINNQRNPIRAQVAAVRVAPVAAHATVPPKPPVPAAAPAVATDLAAVLANVALVNAAVGACGGVESARRVAEAVRACGGVDPFLQHLDLVAGIRSPEAAG